MKTTDEVIKEVYDSLDGNDVKTFILDAITVIKKKEIDGDTNSPYHNPVIDTIKWCHTNKKISIKQFKLINGYTKVIDIFNAVEYKTWD